MKNKAQSEFVGFAIIIIIVAILMLIFLSFSLNKSPEETIQSYETEAFVQSILEYTTTCAKIYEPNFLSIRSLIYYCIDEEPCLDNTNSCELLEQTLTELLENSWKTGEDRPIKAYELQIMHRGEDLVLLKEGIQTSQSKGSSQHYDGDVDLFFTAYS